MSNEFDDFIAITRGAGVLLDTNVLAVWLTGNFDPNLVGRTGVSHYSLDDLLILDDIVKQADQLVTTPHILAEAGNRLKNCVGRKRAYDANAYFARVLANADERHATLPSIHENNPDRFCHFGVADAGIADLAKDTPVVSADAALVVQLQGQGGHAINFNHLRTWLLPR